MLLTSGRRGGEEGLAGTEHALTICGLRARTVNVPTELPVQTSAGEIRTALLVLIDLETEEGTTGRAYVRSYSTFAVEPLRQLVENLGAALEGAALAPLEIERKLQEMFRLLGPQGPHRYRRLRHRHGCLGRPGEGARPAAGRTPRRRQKAGPRLRQPQKHAPGERLGGGAGACTAGLRRLQSQDRARGRGGRPRNHPSCTWPDRGRC